MQRCGFFQRHHLEHAGFFFLAPLSTSVHPKLFILHRVIVSLLDQIQMEWNVLSTSAEQVDFSSSSNEHHPIFNSSPRGTDPPGVDLSPTTVVQSAVSGCSKLTENDVVAIADHITNSVYGTMERTWYEHMTTVWTVLVYAMTYLLVVGVFLVVFGWCTRVLFLLLRSVLCDKEVVPSRCRRSKESKEPSRGRRADPAPSGDVADDARGGRTLENQPIGYQDRDSDTHTSKRRSVSRRRVSFQPEHRSKSTANASCVCCGFSAKDIQRTTKRFLVASKSIILVCSLTRVHAWTGVCRRLWCNKRPTRKEAVASGSEEMEHEQPIFGTEYDHHRKSTNPGGTLSTTDHTRSSWSSGASAPASPSTSAANNSSTFPDRDRQVDGESAGDIPCLPRAPRHRRPVSNPTEYTSHQEEQQRVRERELLERLHNNQKICYSSIESQRNMGREVEPEAFANDVDREDDAGSDDIDAYDTDDAHRDPRGRQTTNRNNRDYEQEPEPEPSTQATNTPCGKTHAPTHEFQFGETHVTSIGPSNTQTAGNITTGPFQSESQHV